jgi:hypothetical protein
VPAVSVRIACDCGYGTVTALDAHIPNADEVRMEHLACSMEDADPARYKRISQSMVAAVWLTAH